MLRMFLILFAFIASTTVLASNVNDIEQGPPVQPASTSFYRLSSETLKNLSTKDLENMRNSIAANVEEVQRALGTYAQEDLSSLRASKVCSSRASMVLAQLGRVGKFAVPAVISFTTSLDVSHWVTYLLSGLGIALGVLDEVSAYYKHLSLQNEKSMIDIRSRLLENLEQVEMALSQREVDGENNSGHNQPKQSIADEETPLLKGKKRKSNHKKNSPEEGIEMASPSDEDGKGISGELS